MLSRLVIAFCPRGKRLLISWLQSPSAVILEPKKIKALLFPFFSHLFAMKWWDWMPWSLFFECWVLSQLFHSPPSLSSRGSLVPLQFLLKGGIICISEVLVLLLAILIPACASSSLAFHMMHSTYKLNKQGDNIQPWLTPFSIWKQFVVRYPVPTVASWPAYRFLRRQARWNSIPISLRIYHSLLWSTQSISTLMVDHYIYYCGQESLRRNGVAIMVNKSPKCSTLMQSQK